jgi:hypothetical protein
MGTAVHVSVLFFIGLDDAAAQASLWPCLVILIQERLAVLAKVTSAAAQAKKTPLWKPSRPHMLSEVCKQASG